MTSHRAALVALLACVSLVDRCVVADSPTLSAGARHTCAIDGADRLHCWGDDSDGQSTVPADVPAWRAVAASKGGCHTCGIAMDGGVRCWGCDANYESSGVPVVPGGNAWISVGAGKGLTCGVASVDRAVRCWGRFMPQVGVNPWYGPWRRVTVGEDWVCALSAIDGTVRCRGWSASGQTTVPQSVQNAAWLDVSAGFQHTCGITAHDRAMTCWGSGVASESTPPSPTELELTNDPTARVHAWGAVASGTHWTCGVVGAARKLKCWGLALDYFPGEASVAFGEFGQVISAGDVSVWGTWTGGGGTCSWDVVTAGKHHACAIVAEPVGRTEPDGSSANQSTGDTWTVDSSDTGPGNIRCWGNPGHGRTTPPSGDGVTLPWRAWPADAPEEATDPAPFTFVDARTEPFGVCAEVSTAASVRANTLVAVFIAVAVLATGLDVG